MIIKGSDFSSNAVSKIDYEQGTEGKVKTFDLNAFGYDKSKGGTSNSRTRGHVVIDNAQTVKRIAIKSGITGDVYANNGGLSVPTNVYADGVPHWGENNVVVEINTEYSHLIVNCAKYNNTTSEFTDDELKNVVKVTYK